MNKLDLLLIFLLLILIGVLIGNIVFLKSEGFSCMKNPGAFTLSHLPERYTDENRSCFCDSQISITKQGVQITERTFELPGK
jgi:uncharacterized membrane protein